MSAVLAARRKVARFELLRELGRGAQARVWLAHDPLLEREVAIKLLDVDPADPGALDEWLHEARAVSRLTHPNIVPVFEADSAANQPYLVFEYVEGPTLSAERRTRPKWAPRDAVQLLLGVLDALAAAHEQGIVHRDLKPSNILLGRDGRPRVMDFGIAARVAHGRPGDGRIVGTPGYMSPEAARAEPPQPTMDVFAAGVLLGELLAGRPLLRETDPWRAVERVQREDLVLPEDVRVDGTLRGIVQRALARDARQRYDTARSLRDALAAWLTPAEAPPPEASNGTLEFLLRRMRHKTDFPALSDAVVRIQRVAASETANLAHLTDEILRDVALTNKLLRMVNSVHFTAVAGGGIDTVSRAVQLVGFAGIRNMALAVLLLEHMADKGHAAHLKEEFVRALMAGSLASELTPIARESEEAFLGSMFQNLGRLLTEYYFPEEAVQIRKRLRNAHQADTAERDAAARQVLGIGLSELGTGVARAWGLPETLQQAMNAPAGDAPARPVARGPERLRWLGRAANGLTDALLNTGDDAAALQAVAERYAGALDLAPSHMVDAVQASRARLSQLTSALGLHMPKAARARRLLGPEGAAEPGPAPGQAAPSGTAPGAPGSAVAAVAAGAAGLPSAGLSAAMPAPASAGLAAVLRQLEQPGAGLRVNELLNLVLETLHRTLALRSVVLCLRDARSGELVGRLALGDARTGAFRFTPMPGGDLFAALTAKGADTLIADAGTVAARLPAWFRQQVNAPTFLLLPLMHRGAPLGLIYADKAVANALVLPPTELALVKGLRDKLVAAITRGTA